MDDPHSHADWARRSVQREWWQAQEYWRDDAATIFADRIIEPILAETVTFQKELSALLEALSKLNAGYYG